MSKQNMKWTPEQEAFLLIKKNEGLTYKEIANLLALKFDKLVRPYTVGDKYRSLISKPNYSKAKLPTTNGSKRQKIIWNQKRIDFLFTCLWNGLEPDTMIQAFEEEFKYKLSMTQIKNCLVNKKPSGKIHDIQKKLLSGVVAKNNPYKETKTKENENMKINWENEPATRKQTRYLVSLEKPNWSNTKVNKSAESRMVTLTKGQAAEQIDLLILASNKKAEEVLIEAKTVKREVVKTITPIETKIVNKRGRLSALELAGIKASSSLEEALDATPHRNLATVAKYFNQRKTPIKTNDLKAFVEKHGNPTTRHITIAEKEMLLEIGEQYESLTNPTVVDSQWTEEEDFDLLCNFYELSIDEARNRFNMPYKTIASRLETLIDSTEPLHQTMLMKAAKVVSARKKAESKSNKVGFFKRRKARKLAKKIARSDKKIAKIEKKLNKMRGE